MSDIPPELIDPPKPVPKLKAFSKSEPVSFRENRLFTWLLILALLVCLLFWPYVSHAATFDPSNTYCELFELDSSNGRYYIVADPPWTPSCPHPWVTVPVAKFQQLVDAYEGSSGSSSPFTADEVAALKYQAANPSPFNLSIPDGTLVSGAIAGSWALAWVLKQLVRALNTDGEKESS